MKRIIYIILIYMAFAGCLPAHYVANNPYVPLHSEKNELKINVTYNSFQIGYSITEQLSFFYTNIGSDLYSQTGNLYLGEISGSIRGHVESSEWNAGGGYYKKKDNFIFEVMVGAGPGKVFFRDQIYYKDYTYPPSYYYFQFLGDKTTYFIQPAFGIIENKNAEVAFFNKLSLCHYYNLTNYLQKSDNLSVMEGDQYFLNKKTVDLYFIEPGLIARMGFKKFKMEIAVSKIVNINYKSQINLYPAYVSLSLFMDFKLFKKKE